MPIGIIVNCTAVFLGGILGAVFCEKIAWRVKDSLPKVFGFCALAMGMVNIIKVDQLPPTIMAIIIGTALGELFYLERGVMYLGKKLQKPAEKIFKAERSFLTDEEFSAEFITIIVLFCASGTGIFGALHSGLTYDHSVLFSKAILDFFTALIFATRLGFPVSIVALPQALIMLVLFFSAELLMPLISDSMLADFSACGGIIMLATGMKLSKLVNVSLANMLPAMVLVFPLSYIWTLIVSGL